MGKFRKKPVIIDVTQWFKNGDHPKDNSHRNGTVWEGAVVRYFRHPDIAGATICKHCGHTMHHHGWIDTLEGGHIV
ncbi:MAG TPA: hypothetical protein DEO59_04230, partial [Balneola sp.]|nr:hypothetical protein [Balneola sp.]